MSDEILEAYIQQYIEAQQVPEVNIAWQGGEPTLMGLEFFEKSIHLVEKYKKPGMQVSYSMQTNATRLDDEWGAFLKEHNFLMGISIDGPPEIHDRYRKDKGGRGSYAQVQLGLDILKSIRLISISCVPYTLPMAITHWKFIDFSGMNWKLNLSSLSPSLSEITTLAFRKEPFSRIDP